jgi:hypothetical protein
MSVRGLEPDKEWWLTWRSVISGGIVQERDTAQRHMEKSFIEPFSLFDDEVTSSNFQRISQSQRSDCGCGKSHFLNPDVERNTTFWMKGSCHFVRQIQLKVKGRRSVVTQIQRFDENCHEKPHIILLWTYSSELRFGGSAPDLRPKPKRSENARIWNAGIRVEEKKRTEFLHTTKSSRTMTGRQARSKSNAKQVTEHLTRIHLRCHLQKEMSGWEEVWTQLNSRSFRIAGGAIHSMSECPDADLRLKTSLHHIPRSRVLTNRDEIYR